MPRPAGTRPGRLAPSEDSLVKKLIAALALCGLFAAGTAVGLAQKPDPVKPADPKKPVDPVKPADPKVDPKKPVDPKDPKAPAVKGSVVIKPDTNGKFRVSIRDENDKTLLMSSTGFIFDTEKEAKEAIDDIKAILATAKVTVLKADAPKDKDK